MKSHTSRGGRAATPPPVPEGVPPAEASAIAASPDARIVPLRRPAAAEVERAEVERLGPDTSDDDPGPQAA